MNHNVPSKVGGESWPAPKGGRDKRDMVSGTTAPLIEKSSRQDAAPRPYDTDPNGVREYDGNEVDMATIWARDADEARREKALIQPRRARRSAKRAAKKAAQTGAAAQPPKSEQASHSTPLSERRASERSEADTTWVDDFAGTPSAVRGSPAVERAFTLPNQETPPPPPERPLVRNSFWNQPNVYSPKDREMLPTIPGTVAGESEPAGGAVAQEAPKTPEPNSPTLDAAVNPNEAAPDASSAVANEEAPKAHSLSRRRNKRAVQSQTMEGQPELSMATEQFPEIPAFEAAGAAEAELTPEEVTLPELAPAANEAVAEAPALEAPASRDESTEHASLPGAGEHVMQRAELLTIARLITIDGVSVYDMFTAKRIDEEGLRRIITEYIRGGDVGKAAAQELIREQMKYERDPQLRDMPVSVTEAAAASTPRTGLKQRTKSLLGERRKDRTERLAELTQAALEKSHDFIYDNPNSSSTLSIAAIIIIYVTILIVAFSK